MKYHFMLGAVSLLLLSSCEPFLESNSQTNTETEITQTESEINTNTVSDTDSQTMSGTDSQTDSETDSQTMSGTDTDIDSETDSQTMTDTDTQTDSQTITDTDSQTQTEQSINVFDEGYVTISQTQNGDDFSFKAHPYNFPENTELTYSWQAGDSEVLYTGIELDYQFDFSVEDEYEISLWVAHGENEIQVHSYAIQPEACLDAFFAEIQILEQDLQTVTFEGKGVSCSNYLEITEFTWDFGDGTTVVTDQPRITHRFEAAGDHTVGFTYELASTHIEVSLESEPAVSSCPEYHNLGERSAKLLTAEQYNNAVFDLTGIEMNADYDVNNVDYQIFLNMANQIASQSESQNFDNILDCEYLLNEDCAHKYMKEVLPLFYRQSPSLFHKSELEFDIGHHANILDIDYYGSLYDSYDYRQAMKLSIVSALSSPQFIFNSNLGDSKEVILERIEMESQIDVVTENTVRSVVSTWDYSEDLNNIELAVEQTLELNDVNIEENGVYNLSIYLSGQPKYISGSSIYPRLSAQMNDIEILEYQYIAWQTTKRIDIEIMFDELMGNSFTLTNELYGIGITEDQTIKIEKIELIKLLPEQNYKRVNNGQFDQFEAGDFILNNWEVASLLSFNYYGSTPDQELIELAMQKELDDSVVVQQQIDRLIASEKSILWGQTQNINTINIATTSCQHEQGE